jgi:pSer/pThr/pTyr-binding forkhead associated (FHA) protein
LYAEGSGGRESRNIEPGNGAALVVQEGPNSGTSHPLVSEITALGRQPDNHVVLDEPVVSRKHAVIEETDAGYYLRDLGSTNGTFVNGLRVEQDYVLQHGDVIRLGGGSGLSFQHIGARTLKLSAVGASSQAIVVDKRARHVYVRGQLLEPAMARKEFDLLMLLDSRRGEAISRDEIASNVWPERTDGDVGDHEIEQCVHRVRNRIEEDTSRPIYLITMRGFGYKLN